MLLSIGGVILLSTSTGRATIVITNKYWLGYNVGDVEKHGRMMRLSN